MRSTEYLRPCFSEAIKPIVELSDEHCIESSRPGNTSISTIASFVPSMQAEEESISASNCSLVRHRSLETGGASKHMRTFSARSSRSLGISEELYTERPPNTQDTESMSSLKACAGDSEASPASGGSFHRSRDSTAVDFLINPVQEPKQGTSATGGAKSGQCGSEASSVSSETLSISLPDSNDSHYTLVYKPCYPRESCYDRTRLPFLPWGDEKNCPSPCPSESSSITGFDWLFNSAANGECPYFFFFF